MWDRYQHFYRSPSDQINVKNLFVKWLLNVPKHIDENFSFDNSKLDKEFGSPYKELTITHLHAPGEKLEVDFGIQCRIYVTIEYPTSLIMGSIFALINYMIYRFSNNIENERISGWMFGAKNPWILNFEDPSFIYTLSEKIKDEISMKRSDMEVSTKLEPLEIKSHKICFVTLCECLNYFFPDFSIPAFS